MVLFEMSEYHITHIGMDIDFYTSERDTLKLSRKIEDEYGLEKEYARIFTECSSNQIFNADEMLTCYLKRSGKSLIEHLPSNSLESDQPFCAAITFPIQFNEDSFHMMTNKGVVDIKTLRLTVLVNT